MSTAAAVAQPIQLAAGRILVNRVAAPGARASDLAPAIATIVLAYVGYRVAGVASGWGLISAVDRTLLALEQRHLLKTIELDAEQLDDASIHDLVARASEAAADRSQSVLVWTVTTLTSLLSLVLMFGLIGSVDPLVGALAAASVIPVVILQRKGFGVVKETSNATAVIRRRRAYLRQLAIQSDSCAELRATNAGPALASMHAKASGELLVRQMAAQARQFRLSAIGNGLGGAFLTLAFALVGVSAVRGHATAGDVALLLSSLAVIVDRSSFVSNGISQILGHSSFIRDYFEFVDIPRLISCPPDPTPIPALTTEGVRFESVHFRYPSGTVGLVDVSLDFAPGSLVAIVGENGAGKSTLVRLLLRMYDPQQGSVSMGGVDLRRADPSQVRDRAAVVFQDFARYELSVRDAVSMGRPSPGGEADDARIWAALESAGIDELVRSMPEGLGSHVGRRFPGGRDLSGGQWQRIALARLFYRDGDIWVLDEPTSSLDPDGEAAIFDALRREMGSRVGIVISHRFSTVRIADRIVVMQAGRVVEEGSHDELMALKGRYFTLFELQASGYR